MSSHVTQGVAAGAGRPSAGPHSGFESSRGGRARTLLLLDSSRTSSSLQQSPSAAAAPGARAA